MNYNNPIILPFEFDNNPKKNIIKIMNYLINNNNDNNWHKLVKSIYENDSPFIQLFLNELIKMEEFEIINMYKNFLNYSPKIFFKDISKNFIKYYKKK